MAEHRDISKRWKCGARLLQYFWWQIPCRTLGFCLVEGPENITAAFLCNCMDATPPATKGESMKPVLPGPEILETYTDMDLMESSVYGYSESTVQSLIDQAYEAGMRDSSIPKENLALNVRHPDCHKAADAFWDCWREIGETHKRGYYESTWGAINRALRTVGVTRHEYPLSASPEPKK